MINIKYLKISAALAIGLIGLSTITPSFAGYYYHHHYRHYHDGNYGGGIAAGIFLGAAAGLIAGAAIGNHGNYYDGNYDEDCRQVFYTRHCDYNEWGDQDCIVIRHVRYEC